MEWFRYWTEALDDEKVQALPAPLFKHWVNLLCVARLHGGRLDCIDQIAFRLRVKVKRATAIMERLEAAGLMEQDGTGWAPHNWAGRQPASDDAAERMRRLRRTRTEQRPNKFVLEQSRAEQNRTEQNRTEQNRAEAASAPIIHHGAHAFTLPESTATPTAAAASCVLAKLAGAFENEIGALSPGVMEALDDWAERIPNTSSGEAAIAYAFSEAVANNKRRWRYVESILVRLEAEGWPADPTSAKESTDAEVTAGWLEKRYLRGQLRQEKTGQG